MGFVELEAAGKKVLEQFPVVKHTAKRVYQVISVITNKEKIKSEGDMVRVSPDDGYEYFYGYYDKSPWDATDRYMICVRVRQAYKSVAPREAGTVYLIDTKDDNKLIEIGVTHSWNVQQSCMAQWMGPDFKSHIIYNDFRNGHYCSVIYDIEEMREKKVLPLPIYDVAHNGSFALSLDFNRLHRMRPGYGYSNQPDKTKGILCPDKTCIWKIDIVTGKVEKLFKYTDLAAFESNETMNSAEHKVNHIMISPNDKRFMVLHRWFNKGKKYTRLLTVNVDKTEMYNLSDEVFVSHCFWKNNEEILSFLRKNTGDHYYLMKDKTQEYRMYWPELNTDGHCSYSFDGKFIITDTYPNRKRIASVFLCTEDDNRSKCIVRVFSPFKYDNNCRCDLHPRWNWKGNKICIDSVHEGKRGMYVIELKKDDIEITPYSTKRKKVTIIRSNKFQLIRKDIISQTFCIKDMFAQLGPKDKIIRDVFLYSRKKIPEKYYNQELKNIDTDIIIIFDPHCRIEFLEWIKNINPKARIILWLWNTVKEIGKNMPIDKVPSGIEIWSYSKYDCKKYDLKYNTTFYPYEITTITTEIEYDVFFIGKDKGRLKDILSIKAKLDQMGLKTYFHITPTHQYELMHKSIYKAKIPYAVVDRLISKSRCILDCEVDETAGLTIRPIEALYKNKKLITNNKAIKDEDFYNPNNIFIYGEDDDSNLVDFVKTEYKKPEAEIFEEYKMESWIQRFL